MDLRQQAETQGYALAPGMFSADEVEFFIRYYTDMVHRGGDGWAEGGVDPLSDDPLRRYPRLLQPHRGDKISFDFMIDPRIRKSLAEILREEPLAVQTMIYFKPPGAKGQALHQDQRYLRVDPGTCIAAWLALDDCDEDNGCMYVVPGSHTLPILCPVKSDMEDSWSYEQVPVPPGMEAVPVRMRAGDVLFFNGQLIHGSHKNQSETRFRRIIVGHYIAAEAERVAQYYFPVFRMDGSDVNDLEANPWDGGPCGVIYEDAEGYRIEQFGNAEEATAAH